ncbi:MULTISPECIES: aromatic ring-hydroxylating dioxygenase subunit alpha [unclassified Variovorax]|uniref:aromatic ring-hydroxylating dioxygenase subunit alpha n=1 Tax=unclassified Variovorax TaxID=663243 RepID=UPI001BD363FA|nr:MULTISPECIES: aromatic ring-hydroxylating dioxygenase subunit alpha [unclassified Variovorax]
MEHPTADSHPMNAARFPSNRWWVAGFAWELKDKPLARTLLGHPMVLFRGPQGVAALEDRCCHKNLPLSCGSVEGPGLRCGYHGLLFDERGVCVEIPGQAYIPERARVVSYPLREVDQILWVWIGQGEPADEPPHYPVHVDPRFKFGGDSFHYKAPYQLIHDNLLDLSHVGYVHQKTIGGNPKLHMSAKFDVTSDAEVVRVTRPMPDSVPPPTYTAAWPFAGRVDRWQEVEFHVSHLVIWTGAMDAGSGDLADANRAGFHIHGFHGVTPETATTSHYFWTVATNEHPTRPGAADVLVKQVVDTFHEDKDIIEAQWANQVRFAADWRQVAIHVDGGPNRARRIMTALTAQQ